MVNKPSCSLSRRQKKTPGDTVMAQCIATKTSCLFIPMLIILIGHFQWVYAFNGTFCADKPSAFYSDPDSCVHFYWCHDHITYHFLCPEGTVYNQVFTTCNHADQEVCLNGEQRKRHIRQSRSLNTGKTVGSERSTAQEKRARRSKSLSEYLLGL